MKILLVDDTMDFLNSTSEWLEMIGHEVTIATTSQDAAELLAVEPMQFDAVITDWDLGFYSLEDGPEVVELAKAVGVPVCLWSGLTRPDTGADLQTTKGYKALQEVREWLEQLERLDNANES